MKVSNSAARNQMTDIERQYYDWGFEAGLEESKNKQQRIRELHAPVTSGGCSDPECCSLGDSEEFCIECNNYDYPCTTIKILDGDN